MAPATGLPRAASRPISPVASILKSLPFEVWPLSFLRFPVGTGLGLSSVLPGDSFQPCFHRLSFPAFIPGESVESYLLFSSLQRFTIPSSTSPPQKKKKEILLYF